MRAHTFALLSLLTLFTLASPLRAEADQSCNGNADDAADGYQLSMICAQPDSSDSASAAGTSVSQDSQDAFVEYIWASVCQPFNPRSSGAQQPPDCAAGRQCPDSAERVWQLWGRRPDQGGWALLSAQCFGRPPTAAQTPKPQVTPGLVLTELRRIGLPSLEAHTQPRDKTLVNFATIFYAEPQTFTRTLTLLGQSVDVEATPTSFTWHYGDGSSATSSTPGAPYPAKDVTHSYTDAHTTVQPSVDVTYSARFRVGNGAWQTIPDTVTIAGPEGTLRISEATAVLSGEYH